MQKHAYNLPATFIKNLFCLDPNEQDLHTTKVLNITDAYIQKLNPCDGNRVVILPDKNESNGLMFWIINSTIGSGHLYVYDSDGTTLLSDLISNQMCHCVCIGNQWGIYTPIGSSGGAGFNPSLYYTKSEVNNIIDNLNVDDLSDDISDNTNDINNIYNQINNINNTKADKKNHHIINNNYLASNNDIIFADTSTLSWTLTLPNSPSLGYSVKILDYKNTWETNNLIVDRNGRNINGVAEDFICDTTCSSVEFIYTDSVIGWKVS